MRKADYLKLAHYLREKIERERMDRYCTEWQANGARYISEAAQARELARYVAEHFSVNGSEFLKACGM